MFYPQERFRAITWCAVLFVACCLLCTAALATPSITLSKKSGPPTSRILVSGSGFEPNVGVGIFFDTKDKTLVVTNGKGDFQHAAINAPRSAHPGEHWVTALERNNDKGAQQPFLVETNWSQFRFSPDHEGLDPYENVLNPATVGRLAVDWTYPMPEGQIIDASPSIDSGMLYIASGGSILAMNAETGAVVWTHGTIGGIAVDCSPAVSDGIVYFADEGGVVYALNALTGASVWRRGTGQYIETNPTVVDGVVYVHSTDGNNLYAFNAKTGSVLWTYQTGGGRGSPAVADGVVYIGVNTTLSALRANTGTLVWKYAISSSFASSPTVSNGIVYAGAADGNVYALNAASGSLLWTFKTGDQVFSSPAVSDGIVYIGSDDHNLYALDALTGALLWTYATGWHVESSPAVANGVLYFGSGDYTLYALSARTGALLWSYVTGQSYYGIVSSPAVLNGKLYVGSGDGHLYAFGLGNALAGRSAVANRPELSTLHPDLQLQPSE